jgi:insulysin
LALESDRFTVDELTSATQALSVRDLEEFLPRHFSRSYGKALVMGNIDALGAETLVRVVQNTLPFTSLPSAERSKIDVTLIPTAPLATAANADPAHHLAGFRVAQPEPNPKDTNSATCFHLQLPSRDPEEYMRVELLAEVLEQPFYHSLRTQQQLGYIVSASLHRREGIRYLTFLAQSSVADGAELTRRIETFLDAEVDRVLDELTEDDLGVFKQGITVRKLEPDQRLTSQAGRFWTEIMSQSVAQLHLESAAGEDGKTIPTVPTPLFDRRAQEVAALQKITLDDFKAFARSFLTAECGQRRLLVSQISSTVRAEEVPPVSTSVLASDSLSYVEVGGAEEDFRRRAEVL